MGKATEARGSRLGRRAKLLALAQFPRCGRAKRRRERMENPRDQVFVRAEPPVQEMDVSLPFRRGNAD